MAWTKSFVPKTPQIVKASQSAVNPWGIFGSGKGIDTATGGGMVPNSALIRTWAEKMPFVKGAKDFRRSQAISAEWDILPKDSTANYNKKKRADAIRLLERPNVNGRNSSFSGLLGPVVEDLITVANGVIKPEYTAGGTIGELNYEDGAQVRHPLNWKSPADGPRYGMLVDNNKKLELYNTDELIVMVLNETTYNPYGHSPVQSIFQQLMAWEDTFMSVYASQKNRTPAGILNLGGMPLDELVKLQSLYDEIQGNSTLAFINHPIDQFKFEQIGSIDLEKMGTPWWIDLIVRCVCTVFQVPPIVLMWTQDVNRATSRTMLKISDDQGIEPLMRQVASTINTDILPTFGEPNLHFVWRDLLVKDQMDSADVLRKLAGTQVVPIAINNMLKIGGLKPYTLDDFNGDQEAYAYVSEPLIWTNTAMMPVTAIAHIPAVQSFEVQQQAALEQSNANIHGLPEGETPAEITDELDDDETEEGQ